MTSFKKSFAAPTFDDEVKTQQAYMLHIILWVLILVPIPFVIYTLLVTPENTNRTFLQALFGEAVNIFLLVILHRGKVRAASIIQVSTFWFFFTATAFTGGGVQGEAYLMGYGLVIAIAGILLGGTGASVFTFLSLTAGIWMVYNPLQGITTNFGSDSTPLTTWVVSVVLFPVVATLQHLASRTTKIALSRARASEEKYRLISQVSSDYTFATEVSKDGSGSLNWAAGAFEKMTGYTYEEYVAAGGWLAHVHPDDIEKDARDMEKLLMNQNVMNSDIRTFTKSGEIRWERIFAHPVWNEKENRLIQIVGAVQDVTLQKRSEEMLNATLLQQTAILNSIPDMAWLKDKDGQYVAVNEQFSKTAGREIENVIGKTDFEIWDMEFAGSYYSDDLEVMRSCQRKHSEELQMDSTGRKYWVETTKTPILNEQGEVVGTVGIAREITERKNAELERETLITELEAKNAELERYTYTVSHDLKSPLVTIRGFLGYLEKDALAGNTQKVKDDIKRIENATQKMHALLNDLLELSRIGRLMNQSTDTLFTELVKDVIDLVHGQIEAKNILIEIQDTPAIIHGDRTRLTEVIQNLVDNAVKFMGNQPRPHITIGTATNEKNETIFFVRDNGIGIDSQYHERIFTLFSKLNADTEGTGIGLTLIKRIIEVHKGHIWLESEPGKGTTFYFTLNQT